MSRPRVPLPEAEARRLRRLTLAIAAKGEALRSERAELMASLVDAGYSVRAVADACGISHPAALDVLAKHRAKSLTVG